MTSTRFSLFCLLVALLPASHSATSFADDDLRECSHFPLAVGTEWVYTSGSVEITQRVFGQVHLADLNDELCAQVDTYRDGQLISFEYIAVREDGVYRVAVMGQAVEPAMCLLKWPAEDGDEWTIDSPIPGHSSTLTLSLGKATVPAGEFETVHVEATSTVPNADGEPTEVSVSTDFAAGVGMVKQVVRFGEDERTMELKEVTFPEQ